MSVLVSSKALFVGGLVFCALGCRVWFFFLRSKFLKIKKCQLKKKRKKNSIDSEGLLSNQRMNYPSVAQKW